MRGVEIEDKFYLFELGGIDVILGIEWLTKLKGITLDWGKSTMTFQQPRKKITIRGDPTLERRVVKPEHLLKLSEVNSRALVWSLEGKEANRENDEEKGLTKEQKEDMERLLGQYTGVFQEPQGLPPNREERHQITLKGGADTVNVRPYRYPHVMKMEIERQVTKMLHAGII